MRWGPRGPSRRHFACGSDFHRHDACWPRAVLADTMALGAGRRTSPSVVRPRTCDRSSRSAWENPLASGRSRTYSSRCKVASVAELRAAAPVKTRRTWIDASTSLMSVTSPPAQPAPTHLAQSSSAPPPARSESSPPRPQVSTDADVPTRGGDCVTAGLALLGSALLWLALPPFDLWPLAWVAPLPWLLLVRRAELPGRRPYRTLYVAGVAFWLSAVYWLTLPHWSGIFGWLALAGYLGVCLPLFVLLCRLAVHRLGVSLLIVAPVVWTALELVRAYLFSGFLMAALGHTQYRWIELIQVSDLVGAYGVSFVVMLVVACVARTLPLDQARITLWPLGVAIAVLAATLGYGYWRTADVDTREGPTVALIQGNIDTQFGLSPDEAERRVQRIWDQYFALTQKAFVEARDRQLAIDVVVWPESMMPFPHVVNDVSGSSDAEIRRYETNSREWISRAAGAIAGLAANVAPDQPPPSIFFGSETHHFTKVAAPPEISVPDAYVTSLHVDASGKVLDRYDKMHLVIFGEYVPLGSWIPALYALSPLSHGMIAGEQPAAFEVAGTRLAPNICYETVIPHVIRRQVAELRRQGDEPDILVTQTNDGWFWGSAELDMHLICGVFRAVECRKPLLTAANTGISAHVDADGRIVARGGRHAEDVIVTRPQLDNRQSPYLAGGDWFAGACLLATGSIVPLSWRRCGGSAGAGWRPRQTPEP
ncbi:MAG: apolipoprotein N-acyltransferase [Planctomycetota bacterium]|nr:MAG: apolipoprotein N-acyltransferase [Planctomycetota bacterium]REK42262.1 MAG: apolipoprotein N-acyltransferase [Planctomycetota bacterium]